MCVAGAGTALTIFGQLFSANAARQSANYNAAVMENNAKIAEMQARQAEEKGRLEKTQLRRDIAIKSSRSLLAYL